MLSMMPSTSPVEVANAFSIIALVANPDAAKARLAELQAVLDADAKALTDMEVSRIANQALVAKLDAAAATQDAANAKADKQAQTKLDAAQGQLNAAQALADKTSADMSTREAALGALQAQVIAQQQDLAQREAVLAAGSLLLQGAQKQHADYETEANSLIERQTKKLAADQAAVDALKADYQARLDKIRSLAS